MNRENFVDYSSDQYKTKWVFFDFPAEKQVFFVSEWKKPVNTETARYERKEFEDFVYHAWFEAIRHEFYA